MNEIVLDTKLVGNIEGVFLVPSYQRGYRWGKEEVERLLDDIYSNGSKGYCLQPIVVKRNGGQYELIDGQQRLTTLYLIYYYMYKISGGFLIKPPKFSLIYETREKSEEFLKNLNLDQREENIDYWFMCEALLCFCYIGMLQNIVKLVEMCIVFLRILVMKQDIVRESFAIY